MISSDVHISSDDGDTWGSPVWEVPDISAVGNGVEMESGVWAIQARHQVEITQPHYSATEPAYTTCVLLSWDKGLTWTKIFIDDRDEISEGMTATMGGNILEIAPGLLRIDWSAECGAYTLEPPANYSYMLMYVGAREGEYEIVKH